jgi:hypothetical protein
LELLGSGGKTVFALGFEELTCFFDTSSAASVFLLSSAILLISAASRFSAFFFSNHQIAPVESHASVNTLCAI